LREADGATRNLIVAATAMRDHRGEKPLFPDLRLQSKISQQCAFNGSLRLNVNCGHRIRGAVDQTHDRAISSRTKTASLTTSDLFKIIASHLAGDIVRIDDDRSWRRRPCRYSNSHFELEMGASRPFSDASDPIHRPWGPHAERARRLDRDLRL
jgi:hypothetical protein